MDNQTRVPDSEWHHRHAVWVDATAEQALSCSMLLRIAEIIGRDEFDHELRAEYERLKAYINGHLWDETAGFYFDRLANGQLSATKSIGAYWALLADVVPAERIDRFVAHLSDPISFKRLHRVPTQAADSAVYDPYGGYWVGGVWSPTNYMVLQGLMWHGFDALAHEIALNHVTQVAAVFAETGTLWENYAPDYAQPGKPAGCDFVGWTGISAITIPLEFALGIRSGPEGVDLIWDIRLSGRHGVLRYPLTGSGSADLICEARRPGQTPTVTVRCTRPIRIELRFGTYRHAFSLEAGEHVLEWTGVNA
jgi:glycogen debranching enzyme